MNLHTWGTPNLFHTPHTPLQAGLFEGWTKAHPLGWHLHSHKDLPVAKATEVTRSKQAPWTAPAMKRSSMEWGQ